MHSETQSWIQLVILAFAAFGTLMAPMIGILTIRENRMTRREADAHAILAEAATARASAQATAAAGHARAAVNAIKDVGGKVEEVGVKVEEVHLATNSIVTLAMEAKESEARARVSEATTAGIAEGHAAGVAAEVARQIPDKD
jgi:hypothetical protein